MATNIGIKVKIQATTFMRVEWMEFHGITSKEKKKKTSKIVQIPLGNWTLFNKDHTLYSNGWTWQHKT
jgi:hypothetical protein